MNRAQRQPPCRRTNCVLCGIAGVLNPENGGPVDRDLLCKMTRSLVHRGPDGEGYFTDEVAGLGHRRLSVIDLATGDQPMIHKESGHVIIFNGEIYNFLELRSELERCGHTFKTSSDTEVLLNAWVCWGEDSIKKLSGMFAFAVWDARHKLLHIVRDRLGKKPLYYTSLPNRQFLFGSELKAVLACPEASRSISKRAFVDYLAYGYVPDPKSIYDGIYKLPPGHRLVLRPGEAPVLHRYWKPEFGPECLSNFNDAVDQLLPRLDKAVHSRLISDVPLGAFLSGGVDSTGVVSSIAARTGDPVNTFSIGFGDPDVDELSLARTHAERYETNHFEHVVSPIESGLFDTVADVYDEPFADSSAMPTYQVCKMARQHATVALSGDGGDEVFAGYRRYQWHMQEEKVRALLPHSIRGPVFGTLAKLYPKLDWAPRVLRFKNTFQELSEDQAGAYFISISVIDDRTREALMHDDLKRMVGDYHPRSVLDDHWSQSETDDPLAQALYVDWQTWLAGRMLVKVDRASMANSLEVRSPLLDYELLSWAATLPSAYKLKSGVGKRILKKALEPRVDRSILYRSKQGFAPPTAKWLRTLLRPQLETAIRNPLMDESGFLSKGALTKLSQEHFSGVRDHSAALWSVLIFDRFLRRETSEFQ